MAIKKNRKIFQCDVCAAEYSKWQGKCESCQQWNTIIETSQASSSSSKSADGTKLAAQSIAKVKVNAEGNRYQTGIAQVDEVLGGGIVQGSVALMAGEPGIGKSTLLLQLAHALVDSISVLYVSGEESASQIKLRSDRLQKTSDKLDLVSSNSTDDIIATLQDGTYKMVIIDSIQTIGFSQLSSNPGSVSQITTSAHMLNAAAKATNTSLILVGHVTKDGTIAGPKVLEHLVDVVLNLEGDRYGGYKVLRGVKNRFGSTNEVALFEMEHSGLIPLANPSATLLQERKAIDGSVVLATLEGTRPLLVEVQALVAPSQFGYPKRTSSGFDINRLNILLAVISRRTKVDLSDKDVFVNIVGGIRLSDPAADLAICMAVGSAAKGFKLKDDVVVFGEVGLSGEIRHVPMADRRALEAKKLGFKAALAPQQRNKKMAFIREVTDVKTALNQHLEKV